MTWTNHDFVQTYHLSCQKLHVHYRGGGNNCDLQQRILHDAPEVKNSLFFSNTNSLKNKLHSVIKTQTNILCCFGGNVYKNVTDLWVLITIKWFVNNFILCSKCLTHLWLVYDWPMMDDCTGTQKIWAQTVSQGMPTTKCSETMILLLLVFRGRLQLWCKHAVFTYNFGLNLTKRDQR